MILALDLSLAGTGYAIDNGRSGVLVPPKGRERGMDRVKWILDRVWNLAEHADLVAIEGYAFGAKNQQGLVSIHELGGVIRFTLWEAGRTIVEIPPTNLKLFAAGKGNAKKDEVFAAAIRQLHYPGNSHDEADALWLLAMVRAHYGQHAKNAEQRRALEKIQWPDVTLSLPTEDTHARESAPALF